MEIDNTQQTNQLDRVTRVAQAVRRGLTLFAQRPDPPRGPRYNGKGAMGWDEPTEKRNVTGYRIYVGSDSALYRQYPVGAKIANDLNPSATLIWISSYNDQSGSESAKVQAVKGDFPNSRGAGDDATVTHLNVPIPGAAITTAEFKGDHISVKAFGATGDGVTDDSVALQAALDYASANGTYLEIPWGTFLHSATLNVTGRGIRIFGQTGQNVVQYTGGGTAWSIHDTGFTIQGLIIRSSRGAYDAVSNPTGAQIGFDLNTCSEYYIQNCFFGGGPLLGFDQAIRCIKSGLGFIGHNTYNYCNNGINLEYGSYTNSHIQITGEDFFAMKRCGICLYNCLQVYITDCYYESCQDGLLLDNSVSSRSLDGGVTLTVMSVGSVFVRRNTFALLDSTTYSQPRAMRFIDGSTNNVSLIYAFNFDDCTVNFGSPAPTYAVELNHIAATPFSAMQFFLRNNRFYGVGTAAIFGSSLVTLINEGNFAYTTGFDVTSAPKAVIAGTMTEMSEYYDLSTLYKHIDASALDLFGNGEHSIIQRDLTATAVDSKNYRCRKFGNGTFLETVNDAFTLIVKGFLGLFSATGNVNIGDPGDTGGGNHIPIDDGVNKVQIQGPAKVYGNLTTGGTCTVGSTLRVFGDTTLGPTIGPTNLLNLRATQPQVDATALGDAFQINGSTTVNGNIVLNPGAVPLNASVYVNTPRTDQPGLIVQNASGVTTGNVFEIRDSLGSPVMEVVGSGDAVVPNFLAVKGGVAPSGGGAVLYDLGISSNRWRKLYVQDIDLTGSITGTGSTPVTSVNGHTGATVSVTEDDLTAPGGFFAGNITVNLAKLTTTGAQGYIQFNKYGRIFAFLNPT